MKATRRTCRATLRGLARRQARRCTERLRGSVYRPRAVHAGALKSSQCGQPRARSSPGEARDFSQLLLSTVMRMTNSRELVHHAVASAHSGLSVPAVWVQPLWPWLPVLL